MRGSRASRPTRTMQSGMNPARARASSRRPAAIRAATATTYEPTAIRRSPHGQKGTFSGLRSPISSWQLDQLDIAERHLQEAGAELAERLGIPRAEEAILPLFPAGSRQPGLVEHPLRRPGDRMTRGDQPDVPPEHALQHRSDERVVRAAEDHRVDLRPLQRLA